MDTATAIETAKKYIKDNEYNESNWPEDNWFSLTNDWDLNLWIAANGDGQYFGATIYPVKNGNADTRKPVLVH